MCTTDHDTNYTAHSVVDQRPRW